MKWYSSQKTELAPEGVTDWQSEKVTEDKVTKDKVKEDRVSVDKVTENKGQISSLWSEVTN